MRIGFDAKRAFLNRTGLGNYSRWLIRSLVSFYPQNSYYAYTPKVKPGNGINFPGHLMHVTTALPASNFFTSRWRSAGIVKYLKRDQVDLYHGLSYELPAGIGKSGIKSVVTVHDLIFMRFPQYFGAIDRFIYRTKIKYACRIADKIIAISERTKQDVIELLNISSDKIEVIYQGCDPAFKQASTEREKHAILEKYNLPAEFILSVGTIEERKNLLLLIKALPRVVTPLKLVVIGRQTNYAKKIKQTINDFDLNDRVIFLDTVNFTDLPAIYQSAKVFVYPSRYEGFGIPVMEALCSGTPVIAATGSCLEEAGGPNSLYSDPNDERELAEKINMVLNDESLYKRMAAKGKEYSGNFDDEKLAAQMMAVYKKVSQHG
jgi:glycosyltransferase involved in cell wall biosynthesis